MINFLGLPLAAYLVKFSYLGFDYWLQIIFGWG